MTRRLPPKKDVLNELLTKSGVYIHLDPRCQGVVVPPQFRKQPELVLQVGLNMAVPIRDLEIDDEGVQAFEHLGRGLEALLGGAVEAVHRKRPRRA